jgi:hypothetical protein
LIDLPQRERVSIWREPGFRKLEEIKICPKGSTKRAIANTKRMIAERG